MTIDSHCHLHDPVFTDLPAVIERAAAHGVTGIIAVGCDPATNHATLAIAERYRGTIWPCLGWHPEWTALTDADGEAVEHQVERHRSQIVALGEIGLPWYCLERNSDAATAMARGRERLTRWLTLAARFDLPVVLHAPHGAAAEALSLLSRHGIERAIFHWHKADAGVTRKIVAAGHLVSVTPDVSHRRRDQELVQAVPLASLLVETDSPWPFGGEFAGLPTEPWMASRVVEEIAKLKGLPLPEIASQLSANTRRLFRLPAA